MDNAWFDSPVMSRNHAEISLDAESNVITIRDIGSMHGTYVNDTQLRRHEPRGLSNDDLVVFGAEVKRNLDTFPACAFRVNYEFLPFKANISYTFPETDDEDYEISDGDIQNEEPSSEDGVSIESPPRKDSQAIDAIDLTRDDSPASVPEADLPGETSIEKGLIDIIIARPADIDHNADPVSTAIYTGSSPILVESDEEDENFSSESDDQSDEVEDDDGASPQADIIPDQEESENEDDDDHEMDFDINAKCERESALASLGLYTLMNQPIPESNVRTIIDASENIVEEEVHDDESDFGLSDAGAEGIRALFDDGLISNSGDRVFEEDYDDESESNSVAACVAASKYVVVDAEPATPKNVAFAYLPSDHLPEMSSSYSHFSAQSSQTNNSPCQTIMNARQPSPSDAAMVKTATPSKTLLNDSSKPVKVHHLPSQDFQKLTAQSLGDKTGKHAFFAAREDNKARIYGGEHAQVEENSSLRTAETEIASIAERKRRSFIAMAKFRERKRRMEEAAKSMASESSKTVPAPSTATRGVNFTIAPLTSLPYLDDHTQTPKEIRTPSPEPDMTSAVTYNESKASMASANKHYSNPSGRSGLSINDIIERGAGDQSSRNLKRKADGISEAIEDEIRVWARSSPAPDSLERSTDMPASASQPAIREEQSTAVPTSTPEVIEQRPTKRLRKIVESVGYVALGGATLFGALVLSAPDFL